MSSDKIKGEVDWSAYFAAHLSGNRKEDILIVEGDDLQEMRRLKEAEEALEYNTPLGDLEEEDPDLSFLAGPKLIPPPVLSEDQEEALHAIIHQINQKSTAILVGAAGTGKTTVMRAFLSYMEKHRKQVICACPTWKAALRFKEAAGREASSVHRVIYGAPLTDTSETGEVRLQFFLRKGTLKGQIPWGCILVIDECSMIGVSIYRDIMRVVEENNASVLFVGDKEQLQPVNEAWGVDFANATATLTKVHRQAEASTPLQFVTAVRENRVATFTQWDSTCRWIDSPSLDVLQAFVQGCPLPQFAWDRTLIAYTNELRQSLNFTVRQLYGLPGELPLAVGEPLLSFANTAGLVNGEQAVVLGLSSIAKETGDRQEKALAALYEGRGIDILRVEIDTGFTRRRVFLFPMLLQTEHKQVPAIRGLLLKTMMDKLEAFGLLDERGRPKFPWSTRGGVAPVRLDLLDAYHSIADVQYGYALTAHKSQGSQWKKVMVFLDKSLRAAATREGSAFLRRWVYTAASRCQEEVTVCNLPG